MKDESDDFAYYISMAIMWRVLVYTMKICLARRGARLESPLHSADIGVVWGPNLPLTECRSRIRIADWPVGTSLDDRIRTKKQAGQSSAAVATAR